MPKKTLSQRFGECTRDVRNATGMNQTVFGEHCGFSQTYLSRLENGQANPTLSAIEIIANAGGLTVFELFEKLKRY